MDELRSRFHGHVGIESVRDRIGITDRWNGGTILW